MVQILLSFVFAVVDLFAYNIVDCIDAVEIVAVVVEVEFHFDVAAVVGVDDDTCKLHVVVVVVVEAVVGECFAYTVEINSYFDNNSVRYVAVDLLDKMTDSFDNCCKLDLFELVEVRPLPAHSNQKLD